MLNKGSICKYTNSIPILNVLYFSCLWFCFSFFDGDFYTSIIDSFNKIFHNVQRGGIIIIDDCGWNCLGVSVGSDSVGLVAAARSPRRETP